jgi:hypothetical protein
MQEILEKVSGSTNEHRLPIIVGGTYNKNATVLSITGKGRLYYALATLECQKSSDATSEFKIIIDGEVVMHVASTSNTSYYSIVHCGIMPLLTLLNKDADTNGSSIALVPSSLGGGGTHAAFYPNGYNVSSQFSSQKRSYTVRGTSSYQNSTYDHIFINDFITFNESLVVEYIYGNKNTSISVAYSLDE